MCISILLVDDNTILRETVQTFLEDRARLRVVGSTAYGKEAVSLVERLHPDVVVLDWGMPDVSGLDVLRQVKGRFPEVKVVFLSMHADEAYVSSSIQNGADAYVLKDDIVTHLDNAIRAAAAGGTYIRVVEGNGTSSYRY